MFAWSKWCRWGECVRKWSEIWLSTVMNLTIAIYIPIGSWNICLHFPLNVAISSPNVGKYTIHGSYGICCRAANKTKVHRIVPTTACEKGWHIFSHYTPLNQPSDGRKSAILRVFPKKDGDVWWRHAQNVRSFFFQRVQFSQPKRHPGSSPMCKTCSQ